MKELETVERVDFGRVQIRLDQYLREENNPMCDAPCIRVRLFCLTDGFDFLPFINETLHIDVSGEDNTKRIEKMYPVIVERVKELFNNNVVNNNVITADIKKDIDYFNNHQEELFADVKEQLIDIIETKEGCAEIARDADGKIRREKDGRPILIYK